MLSPAGCLQQTSETSKQRRVDELYSMLEKWEEGSTNASLPFFHLFLCSGKYCGWLRKFLNDSKWGTAYNHYFFRLLLLPWLCHWIICWLHIEHHLHQSKTNKMHKYPYRNEFKYFQSYQFIFLIWNLLKYKEFPRLTANRVNVRVLDQYIFSLNFLDEQVHSIKGMY